MPRLTLAHLPVCSAILCTMFFNGSYAWEHAGATEHRVAAVALALTIDVAKASFLSAAAHMRTQGKWLGAIILFLLFWPALAYSTFAGYGYLATTRAVAGIAGQAASDEYARAKSDYDRLSADLATAKASEDWQATAACSRARTPAQRAFCQAVSTMQAKLDAASTTLSRTPPAAANPELTGLAAITGLSPATLLFLVAFFPAVLIELLAGFGLYALRPRMPPEASQRVSGSVSGPPLPPQRPVPLETTSAPPAASDATPAGEPAQPKLIWKTSP